jgi:hypothetical protein
MAKETASLNSRVSGSAISGMKDDQSCKLWTVKPLASFIPTAHGISESFLFLFYITRGTLRNANRPKLGDRFTKRPVTLGTQRTINWCMHDVDTMEVPAKHKAKAYEDAMVQAWPSETSSVHATGFVLWSQASADISTMRWDSWASPHKLNLLYFLKGV